MLRSDGVAVEAAQVCIISIWDFVFAVFVFWSLSAVRVVE